MERLDEKNRQLLKGEQQKKNGRYEYRYRDQYGKIRSIYSWRLTQSDPVPDGKRHCLPLRDLEREIERDLHDKVDTYISKTVTLNERFDLYMKNKIYFKESTVSNYRYMYDKYVRKNIGSLKMSNINSSKIEEFYNDLITKKGFQPASVEAIHTVINPVFAKAERDNIIRCNPCSWVMAEIRKFSKQKKPQKVKGMTGSEQKKFVDYMLSNKVFANWVNVITVLLGTGMRISELRGLTWQNISFENNEINIEKQLIYRQWVDEFGNKSCYDKVMDLKTVNADRVIPMEPKVREALLNERERQKTLPNKNIVIDGYRDWVFLNRFGNVLSAKSTNSAIANIIKSYNCEEKLKATEEKRDPVYLPHQSNHMLRHTFCTRMIEKCCEPNSKINIKIVQELMGHNDAATTLNIYTDVSKEFLHQSMSRIEGEIYLGS